MCSSKTISDPEEGWRKERRSLRFDAFWKYTVQQMSCIGSDDLALQLFSL
jgi:hypothetical protein